MQKATLESLKENIRPETGNSKSGLILTLTLNSENILHTISYQSKMIEEIEELCAKGQNPSKKRLDERIIYFSKRSSGGELTSNII